MWENLTGQTIHIAPYLIRTYEYLTHGRRLNIYLISESIEPARTRTKRQERKNENEKKNGRIKLKFKFNTKI